MPYTKARTRPSRKPAPRAGARVLPMPGARAESPEHALSPALRGWRQAHARYVSDGAALPSTDASRPTLAIVR